MVRWRVEDKVRTSPRVRPGRYADRMGVVVEVRRVSERGTAPIKHEIGVRVGQAVAWFLPSELERA